MNEINIILLSDFVISLKYDKKILLKKQKNKIVKYVCLILIYKMIKHLLEKFTNNRKTHNIYILYKHY